MSLLLYTERGWSGSILILCCGSVCISHILASLHGERVCSVFCVCLHQSCPCFFTRREGGLLVFCVWFYTVLCFDCLHQSCPCFFTRREGGLVIFCVWFYTVLCVVLFASVMSLLLYTERGWPDRILCLVLHCAVFLFCLHQSCPCFFTRREGGLVIFCVFFFYTVLCFCSLHCAVF